MSSKPRNFLAGLSQTVGFRLAFGYALLFALSGAATLWLAYYSLDVSLAHRDHESLREKFHDMESDALTSTVIQLQAESRFERKRGRRGPFFMRIISPRGDVFYELGQLDWTRLDGLPRSRTTGELISLPGRNEDEPVLEVISRRISPALVLQVGKATDVREDTLARFAVIAGGVMVAVLLLAVGGGVYMARRALRPVRRLISTVGEVHSGAFAARVPLRGTGDEFDELGKLFNLMLARIEGLVAGMRQALDNVAHDLRTPMTRLRGTAELALQGDSGLETCREALAECLEESDLVLEMLKTLMDISEAETGTMKLTPERVDLGELLREAVGVYRYAAEDKSLRMSAETKDRVWLECDRNRIRQVVCNLLDNAVKYTPAGGRVRLEARRQGSEAVVTVSDTGPGIPPAELPKIWDRLYRGDASRSERGLGLGLSLVKAVVAAHGGRVEVESVPGHGSRFSVRLPASRL